MQTVGGGNGNKRTEAYIHSVKMSFQARLTDYKRRGGVNDVDAYHADIMELVKLLEAKDIVVRILKADRTVV